MKCEICGKETTFSGDWKYLKFCSYKCAHKNVSWDLNRLNSHFCEKCYPYKPKLEDELFDYIKEIYKDETIIHDRNILKPKELDIYIYQN